MSNGRLRKIFTVLFIVCLSIPAIYPLLGMNQSDSNPDTQFFLSDGYPPNFDLSYQPKVLTYDTGGQPLTVAVEFKVGVDDPDGIERVTARYRPKDSTDWSYIALEFVEVPESYTSLYAIQAFNYTLDANHTSAFWYIRFRAADTLGNTADSQETSLSISVSTIWDGPLGSIAQLSLAIVMIVLVGVVIIVFPVTMVRKLR